MKEVLKAEEVLKRLDQVITEKVGSKYGRISRFASLVTINTQTAHAWFRRKAIPSTVDLV